MLESEDSERSSSSSEEEDDDAKEITEEVEKSFLRTLSCLRKKDPKIYDSNVKFFNDEPVVNSEEFKTEKKEKKKKKEKKESMTVRQYETKLLLERGPEFIEDEDVAEIQEPSSPTYIEEQKAIKENFKKILEASDSDDDSEDLFKIKEKPKEEKQKEEKAFKKWLKGQREDLEDKETKKDLQYLHDCWTDPNIDKAEEFLKDYILNKRYLEKDEQSNENMQEDLSEEEEEIKKADEFEHKYNFRFEEPDREFLKRYPRDIESSMRRKKDKQEKRRLQREKAKERKQQKFQEKQKEVGEFKKKKREELVQQIQKLKDVTGNDKLAFENELMDGDFDSCDWDQKMEQYAFDYSYDNQEDSDFVMDCDFDPQAAKQKKLEKKLKSKDKKKNKLTSNDSNDLPDELKSNSEAFEKYIDEFYRYDFEDLIDDLACRFKYRKVVPNSYGLTIDEILAADDDELEKWCSIKKVDSIRSDHVEKNEAKIFAEKARNEALKRKILPSLYKYKEADEFDTKPEDEKKKKKKKKKKAAVVDDVGSTSKSADLHQAISKKRKTSETNEGDDVPVDSGQSEVLTEISSSPRKKKKRKRSETNEGSNVLINSVQSEVLTEISSSPRKKKKRKRSETNEGGDELLNSGQSEVLTEISSSPRKKKKYDVAVEEPDPSDSLLGKKKKKHKQNYANEKFKPNSKKFSSSKFKHRSEFKSPKGVKPWQKSKIESNDKLGLSDARLQAYGINPKKYKSKLIYGSKNN